MTSRERVVAVIGTGDMGHAVGGALVRAGYRVVTAGAARSELTRRLAREAGIEDVGSLEAAVGTAALVLSIVPPAAATTFAADAAGAMLAAGVRPVFAECNAVAPATVQAIERALRATGAPFCDVGIVGRGPAVGREPTRFYVSGEARAAVLALRTGEIELHDLGSEVGRASAMKMAYSSLNKGTDALLTAVLLAAARLGVLEPLLQELRFSQVEALERMEARVPFLGATAKRYAPATQRNRLRRRLRAILRSLARTPPARSRCRRGVDVPPRGRSSPRPPATRGLRPGRRWRRRARARPCPSRPRRRPAGARGCA